MRAELALRAWMLAILVFSLADHQRGVWLVGGRVCALLWVALAISETVDWHRHRKERP